MYFSIRIVFMYTNLHIPERVFSLYFLVELKMYEYG